MIRANRGACPSPEHQRGDSLVLSDGYTGVNPPTVRKAGTKEEHVHTAWGGRELYQF